MGLPRGREKEAAELLAEIKRQVAAGKTLGLDPGQGTPTFVQFFEWWIEQRKARKFRTWKNDESRIRNHVLEALGPLTLDEITPLHLERVFLRMRDNDRAPKTVWNAYSSVRALYRDALKKGFVTSSPCVLGKEELGAMVDKDPEWRATAIYTPDEAASLLFDSRVPADRRVYYGIMFLGGRRLGETSGLRVRQVDLDRDPLGSMLFAHSYDQGRTKTDQTVTMPVHPVLAPMLRWWLTVGFREVFGRDPEPHDFVVPRAPGARSKHGPCRDKNYVRKGHAEDLKKLGFRHRRVHDLRRSFITQAQQGGANPQVLMRLTHPSTKKATAFAGYTEY